MKRSTQGTPPRVARSLKTPGKNGFRYRERFGVIVLCTDAAHQQRVYERLQKAGHRLRVVTV
jgi:hypothetical protein